MSAIALYALLLASPDDPPSLDQLVWDNELDGTHPSRMNLVQRQRLAHLTLVRQALDLPTRPKRKEETP